MSADKKIRIAIVGLGFGAEFIPIYQAHPDANLVAVCQRDPKKLSAIASALGIEKSYSNYDEMLRDPAGLTMALKAKSHLIAAAVVVLCALYFLVMRLTARRTESL